MNVKIIITALISLCCLIGAAQASGPIAVIVNSNNMQTLSFEDVQAIYSDTMSAWQDGKKIVVYTLPVLSSSSETFWQAALGKSALQAASDESNRRITNTAKNKQKQKSSRPLMAIVGKNARAIGFVENDKVAGNNKVRVVLVLQ